MDPSSECLNSSYPDRVCSDNGDRCLTLNARIDMASGVLVNGGLCAGTSLCNGEPYDSKFGTPFSSCLSVWS